MTTTCNPLNLSYRFQAEGINDICCREAADPSVVEFEGKFWLFPSKSSGYWWTDDLQNWNFVKSKILPVEDYAPDVRVINNWLYFTASSNEKDCPIFRTKNPMADNWEKVSDAFPFWDPNMFQDDDGRVYLYWGCSDKKPIWGTEMDPEKMLPIGEKIALISQNHDKYGWERKGENNQKNDAPYVEGAWMNKHNGKYYLQYAAPGTEHNVYGDGVYEGDSPLGPFTYANNNPFSFKPGGFITGAGHGSTFSDHFGNLWHTSTMRISLHHDFERRIGLWPAGFDKDGILFCNNRFGDYPMKHPSSKWDPWQDSFSGWMLLNYLKPVEYSSQETKYPAFRINNENIRNYWVSEEQDKSPWLIIDLEKECTINAIQINFAEHKCQQHGRSDEPLKHQYNVFGSTDKIEWETLIDKADNNEDVPHDYIELPPNLKFRYIKVVIQHMPAQGRAALSGVRIFGSGSGEKPESSSVIKACLQSDDPLTAYIEWQSIPEAIGYNIRWGIAPDKLYHDWLVYGKTSLNLTAINQGQETWIAVEAFNENGVAKISPAAIIT